MYIYSTHVHVHSRNTACTWTYCNRSQSPLELDIYQSRRNYSLRWARLIQLRGLQRGHCFVRCKERREKGKWYKKGKTRKVTEQRELWKRVGPMDLLLLTQCNCNTWEADPQTAYDEVIAYYYYYINDITVAWQTYNILAMDENWIIRVCVKKWKTHCRVRKIRSCQK